MKNLVTSLRRHSIVLLAYLGDAAHRRFVATGIALLATHALGKALDADVVATYIEIGVGAFGGAWSSRTPSLSEGE